MTTVENKQKARYVEQVQTILIMQADIPIDAIIVVDGLGKIANGQKQLKMRNLMRIAQECATLPTLYNHSPDQILEYDQSHCGLWGV